MPLKIILLFILLIFSIYILGRSAHTFVEKAKIISLNFNISTIIIGIIVLGFGTSTPEMIVGIFATLEDKGGIIIGNALGSNIANIALILGWGALIAPLVIRKKTIIIKMPLVIIASLIPFILGLDLNYNINNAVIMIVSLLFILGCMIYVESKDEQKNQLIIEINEELQEGQEQYQHNKSRLFKHFVVLIMSLVVLMVSSRFIVYSAVELASLAKISDEIIAIVIIAIGTSLPELASTITAIKKQESDIAIGGMIGSNIFNMLAVLSIPAMIKPFSFSNDILIRDFPIMFLITFGFYIVMIFAYLKNPQKIEIGKKTGVLFLTIFSSYILFLLLNLGLINFV